MVKLIARKTLTLAVCIAVFILSVLVGTVFSAVFIKATDF
jgi:hypothetical protein